MNIEFLENLQFLKDSINYGLIRKILLKKIQPLASIFIVQAFHEAHEELESEKSSHWFP